MKDASILSSFTLTGSVMDLHDDLQFFGPERCTWSEIAEEAKELVDLHEKPSPTYLASCSDFKRVRRAGKCKGKETTQFHIHSRDRYLSPAAIVDDDQEPCEDIEMPDGHDFDQNIARDTCSEVFLVVPPDKIREGSQLACAAAHDRNSALSISALLGNLEKQSGESNLTSRKLLSSSRKDRRFGFTGKKNPQTSNKFLESNHYPELSENDISSSDEDEKKYQSSSVTGEKKEQKMLDLFDVFTDFSNATEWRTLNHARSDYHVRLQSLLQSEKDIQTEFLKQMQMKLFQNDERKCFYAQILSRSFDARLIVSQCLTYDNIEQLKLRSEKCILEKTVEKTIIFRSKICKDVELEVGNFICIYFPWTEVQVNEGEEIILCAFFSQIAL